ncbi:MAG: hypothetical protein IJ409_06170 [Lachnospiraceae bacterium]|nr:hypothetical protein [Lachnospiraceae bacterium]
MKFPFFASFIVFCIWLGYEIHRHRNKQAKADQEFWQKEAEANSTRRKSLDDLDYIKIPFDSLPMDVLKEDSQVADYHNTLQELSGSPIVNFTGISNTDLKLQYGAPNIDLLSRYDQSYTNLVRTLQNWAQALFENGYTDEACTVLEFAVSTRTDISSTYKLLSKIYKQNGTPEKIEELLPIAESLNSGMKSHILAVLKEATGRILI